MEPYEAKYRVVYLIVTNRPVMQETLNNIKKDVDHCKGLAIIASHNLQDYVSLAFSSYTIFDDAPNGYCNELCTTMSVN